MTIKCRTRQIIKIHFGASRGDLHNVEQWRALRSRVKALLRVRGIGSPRLVRYPDVAAVGALVTFSLGGRHYLRRDLKRPRSEHAQAKDKPRWGESRGKSGDCSSLESAPLKARFMSHR